MTPCLTGINWCDFLARPAVESPPLKALFTHFRSPLLVTGAGGSQGSALALRLARLTVPSLLLLESSENNLSELEHALAETSAAHSGPSAPATFILVSIQSNRLGKSKLQSGLSALHSAVDDRDISAALSQLRSLVPDFHPSKAVLALASSSSPRASV